MTLKEKVIELKESGLSWKQVAEELEQYYPDLTMEQRYDKARNSYRRENAGTEEIGENDGKDEFVASNKTVSYNGNNGETTFEGIVALMDGEPITPESILKAHNLNFNEWEVVSYRNNFWQAQKKNGETILLYQSKITVRPKKANEITFEEIDKYFEKKDYGKDRLLFEPINYDENGEILIVKVADLHIGLLSWDEETGENYDIKIAKERYLGCIHDIISRCEGKKFKAVKFITLGDILHVDSLSSETTKSTHQDSDGRLPKMVETAEDILIETIELLEHIAPVEYIFTCGNHSRASEQILARSVSNVFRRDKNVTCDYSPNPIKSRLYGSYLELYHHGDAPKKNIGELPMKYAREYLSKAKFVSICFGHFHDEEIKSVNGARVRYFPTICSSSYWEHQQAYSSSLRAIVCDIVNEKTGLRDTWYTTI